ncbi:hypothetical protein GmHk_19G053812 [Glycine max]|nr:hypothetical protein GmHk_19G053812 [Glycine max]
MLANRKIFRFSPNKILNELDFFSFFISWENGWLDTNVNLVTFFVFGNEKKLEFGSMKTKDKAIFIHTLIFFALYSIFILIVKVHIYTS